MTAITANLGAVLMSRSQLIRLIRRTDEYEQWKRSVFIRDRFSCQLCGRRNGRKRVIEAHHLVELSALVKEYGVQTVEEAKECKALWALSNGQTLCHSCHVQTHSYPKNFKTEKKRGKQRTE